MMVQSAQQNGQSYPWLPAGPESLPPSHLVSTRYTLRGRTSNNLQVICEIPTRRSSQGKIEKDSGIGGFNHCRTHELYTRSCVRRRGCSATGAALWRREAHGVLLSLFTGIVLFDLLVDPHFGRRAEMTKCLWQSRHMACRCPACAPPSWTLETGPDWREGKCLQASP